MKCITLRGEKIDLEGPQINIEDISLFSEELGYSPYVPYFIRVEFDPKIASNDQIDRLNEFKERYNPLERTSDEKPGILLIFNIHQDEALSDSEIEAELTGIKVLSIDHNPIYT